MTNSGPGPKRRTQWIAAALVAFALVGIALVAALATGGSHQAVPGP